MKYKYLDEKIKPIPQYKVGDKLYGVRGCNSIVGETEEYVIRRIEVTWSDGVKDYNNNWLILPHYSIDYYVKHHNYRFCTGEDREPEDVQEESLILYPNEEEALKVFIENFILETKSRIQSIKQTANKLGCDVSKYLPSIND